MNVLGKGVYFLFKGEQLVYIGKSAVSIYTRIGNHCADPWKDFDSWECREKRGCSDRELLSLESYLISYFQPPLNTCHAHHSYGHGANCKTKSGYLKAIDRVIREYEHYTED